MNSAGFRYAEIQFDRSATAFEHGSFDALAAELESTDSSDVLVFAHGWNNDMDQARRLYEQLAQRFRAVLEAAPPPGLGQRRFAILGALWPSKRWAERELIPGGAASAQGDAEEEEVQQRVDALIGVFDALDADERLRHARHLIEDLADSPAACDEFVDLVRGVLPTHDVNADDDYAEEFAQLSGYELLERLRAPIRLDTTAGDAGGAAGLVTRDNDRSVGLSLTGIRAAAERFLNLTTYYQMKARAGLVGAHGLAPILQELRARAPGIRLHLVGHSFGGRLVTACTAGDPDQSALAPDTLSLLQAAFSHYGFARDYEDGKDGFFRRLVTDQMTRGPVLITHSIRDTAVGYAYPLASRLAGQVAAGLGDAHDRYGGIGRNGAQKTPEADAGELKPPGSSYAYAPHRLLNLNADDVIRGHSDICQDAVAYAILAAIASVQ
ncbi:MAG: hypothetical protein ACLP01_24205 [Solirubrobacteraceae bacterium]